MNSSSKKKVLENNKRRLILLHKRKFLIDELKKEGGISDKDYEFHLEEIDRISENIEMQNNYVLRDDPTIIKS